MKVIEKTPLKAADIRAQITIRSGGLLRVASGTLFPALDRLTQFLELTGAKAPTGKKIILYGLNWAGRKRLLELRRDWRRSVRGLTRIVHEQPKSPPRQEKFGNQPDDSVRARAMRDMAAWEIMKSIGDD